MKKNEWEIVIKDLKNIRKLPLEIWEYILDISNIHYMPWKYSIKNSHENIKNNLSTYLWGSVYNRITKLYSVNVFTRYHEPYLTFKQISIKKKEKIVSNENMPEYIMTNVTNNKIIFE
tara:strand:+ start:10110 stop:10463 length:354 start_codon:yes stop_codon:yes gene_type:complete